MLMVQKCIMDQFELMCCGIQKVARKRKVTTLINSENSKCVGNVRKESPVSRDFVTCKCDSKACVRGASSWEYKIRLQ